MRQERVIRRPAKRDASRRRPAEPLVVRDLVDGEAADRTDELLTRIDEALEPA